MPLVANSGLPAFEDLKREGETVVPFEAAVHQDIRLFRRVTARHEIAGQRHRGA